MRIVSATQIECSIETVFDFLTTPGNWPRWHPSTVAVSGATDHSLEVGEQVTEEYVVAGKEGRATWTVREHRRPHRWVFDTIAENGHQATISYTFASEGTGTRFDREVVVVMPANVPAAYQAEFEHKVTDESAEALRRVKRIMESERRMKPEIFWIQSPTKWPTRDHATAARGGDWLADEVRTWRTHSVDMVLSLLTADEVGELDLEQEHAECDAQGIEFRTFPIPDRNVPASKSALLRLATELANDLIAGKNIAIHCRQGIGRAALVAICTLVVAGMDLQSATTAVREARGCDVPETPEQKRWIAEFANSLPAPVPK